MLIAALIDAYVAAHETHRPALVDWMEALQPLDAPAWTLIDRAAARLEEAHRASARRPRATDLDQPRSQPLRDRLEATLRLLADPIDDVRRSAIRTVGHARFAPAVPALVARLTDKSAPVRRAAAEALVYLGEPSRGALCRALAGARPDRRDVYAQVLERLGTDDA